MPPDANSLTMLNMLFDRLSLGRKKGGGNKLGGGTGSTFAMAGRKGPSAKPKQKLSSLPIFSTVARGGGGGDFDELDEFDF